MRHSHTHWKRTVCSQLPAEISSWRRIEEYTETACEWDGGGEEKDAGLVSISLYIYVYS